MTRSLVLRVVEGPDRGAWWAVGAPRTVGREGDLVLTDPTVSRRHLAVEPAPDGLRVTDLRSAVGTRVDGRPLDGPTDLRAGARLRLGDTELLVLRLARFHPVSEEPQLVVDAAGTASTVAVHDGLTLGRDPGCDVVVPAGEVSRVHAVLRWDGTTATVEDNRSSNGTFVNGRRIERPTPLRPGDRLDLGRSSARIRLDAGGDDGGLTMVRVQREGSSTTVVRTVETAPHASVAEVTAALVAADDADASRSWSIQLPERGVLLHPDDEWAAVALDRGAQVVLCEGDASELPGPHSAERAAASDRRANQLPRTRWPAPVHEVSRPRPPESTSFRGRGTLWQVIGGVAAVVVGLGMAVVGGRQYALFGIMAGLIGVVTVGASIAGDQSRRRHRLDEYRTRVDSIDAELAATRNDQIATARDLSPDDAELAARIERASSRLWERRPSDTDALHLRIGTGRRPMAIQIEGGRDHDSPYEGEIDEVVGRYTWLDDVPVCCPGPSVGTIGVCGDPVASRELVTRMVVEAAAVHSPRQLALWVAASSPDWDWCRWLPHGGAGDRGTRVSGDAASAQAVLSDLKAHMGAGEAPDDELQLLVVDLGSPGSNVAAVGRTVVGRGLALVLVPDRRDLPDGLGAVIEVAADGTAGMIGGGADGPEGRFRTVGMASATAEDLAIRLGALSAPAATAGSGGLLEVLGLGDVDSLDVAAAWASPRPEPLTVAIGVDDDGEPVTIGFRRDGPHGMVAGTTGSGKSELLQSLLVALAATHPPSELELFLIDFKGGATFAPLASLPHVAGLVTDLEGDGSLAGRAFTALDAEIERRKRVLERAGVANIVEHARLPSSLREDLPNLLVVIDEFALLVERQPEVRERLDTVATQGRSLGVHLLLATQSPSGVVTHAIRTNTNLWICLRVVSDAESMELLGSRDAARIPDNSPGRGFVRLGAGEDRRPLQTARIARPLAGQTAPVTIRDGDGVRLYRGPIEEGRSMVDRTTEMDVVVDAIGTAAAETGRSRARPLWLPPLPDVLRSDDVGPVERRPDALVALLGMVDRPDLQAREPFLVDLTASGHALVSGLLGFGKTTALLQTAVDLAGQLPPSALHLYGIEAGGGDLAPLAQLPHTGAVVPVGDAERLMRLLVRLTDAVERRRAGIADAGAGNFPRWRAAGGEPWTVLLLDDYPSFKEAAEQIELGRPLDLFNSLLQNGPAVGIHVVVAVSQAGDLRLSQTSLIPTRVLFRQSEAGEYSLLELRLRPSEVPVGPPGRALVAGGRSVQVCLPDVDALEAAAVRWTGDPVGARPRPVGRLPATVVRSSLSRDRLTGPWDVTVGVGGPELDPVTIDLPAGSAVLVAGPLRSGRSSTLLGLLDALVASDPDVRVTVVAPRPSPLRDLAGRPEVAAVVTDTEQLGALLETLVPAADARTVLVIDDAETLANAYGVADRLDELVRRAGETGARTLVAARVNDLPGIYDPWIRYLVSLRRVVLLQPTADDAFVFGAKLPVIPAPGTPGRGVLVDGHRVLVLQVAGPDSDSTPAVAR